MPAKELHYKRTSSTSQNAISKTIITSVVASVSVAILLNVASMIILLSKMTVTLDVIERRVTTLEVDTRSASESKHMLEVNMAKQGQVLDRMQADLIEIKNDIRSFQKTQGERTYGTRTQGH